MLVLRRQLSGLLGGAFAGLSLPAGATSGANRLQLVMFVQSGCPWCARSNNEAGPAYDKTSEGRAAEAAGYPCRSAGGPVVIRQPQFPPTFVLLKDGAEIDRVEGYPGEDLFRGVLDGMISSAEAGTVPKS